MAKLFDLNASADLIEAPIRKLNCMKAVNYLDGVWKRHRVHRRVGVRHIQRPIFDSPLPLRWFGINPASNVAYVSRGKNVDELVISDVTDGCGVLTLGSAPNSVDSFGVNDHAAV